MWWCWFFELYSYVLGIGFEDKLWYEWLFYVDFVWVGSVEICIERGLK